MAVCVSTVHEQQGTFPQNGQKGGEGTEQKRPLAPNGHWMVGGSVSPLPQFTAKSNMEGERKRGEIHVSLFSFFCAPALHMQIPFPPFLKPCMTLFPQQKKAFFRGSRRGYSAFFLGGGGRREGGDWRPYRGGGGGSGKGHSKRYRKGRERGKTDAQEICT